MLFTILILLSLMLSGCSVSNNPLQSFIVADPLEMECLTRKYNSRNAPDLPYTNFWEVESEYEFPEGFPDDFRVEFNQRLHFGFETIVKLQEHLKSSSIVKTELKPEELDLIYLVKLKDGSLYYFYSTYYIKVISNDETRTIYVVNNKQYREYISTINNELMEALWY